VTVHFPSSLGGDSVYKLNSVIALRPDEGFYLYIPGTKNVIGSDIKWMYSDTMAFVS